MAAQHGPEKHSPVQHCLVFDPIAFKGGSKIATREIIALCDPKKVRFTIATRDPDSWRESARQANHIRIIALRSAGQFSRATQGMAFWMKHLIYLMMLLRLRFSAGPFDTLIGASGPGVDMALYLLNSLFKCRIIQLIHGPVGRSRATGRALMKADQVFFLASARSSMADAIRAGYRSGTPADKAEALTRKALSSPHFHPLTNGLSQKNWPTPCQYNQPTLFWCASLLKWKGLDLLLEALKSFAGEQPQLSANICFIRPKDSSLEVSQAPQRMERVYWFHDPDNLDQIRSQSNIFVSTSNNEPFGLSVLEAMAAEMCVIIPRDNAYWDTVLTHNVNCLKYQPDDPQSLAEAILQAVRHPALIQRLGQSAARQAQDYQAEITYQPAADCIQNPHTPVGCSQFPAGETQ